MKTDKKEVEKIYIEPEKDKIEAQKIMGLFQKAKNFNSDRQEAYAENMAIYQGNQHLLKKYKTEQPWIINMNTPHASVAIDDRISSLLATDYVGALLPLTKSNVDLVKSIEKVYINEWKRMNIDKIVTKSINTFAVIREAYCHITVNKNKKRVSKPSGFLKRAKRDTIGVLEASFVDPSCVYIDPTARRLKDAGYMFVADRISWDEAKELFPKIFNEFTGKIGDTLQPADRGEVFYDNDYETEQDDVLSDLMFYQKCNGKIKRVRLINGIIVDKATMPVSVFPIAQGRWKAAYQSCYGLSLMDSLKSSQKAINAIESAVTNTAVAYAAPSMMVRKGCGVDPKVVSRSNGAPGVVYAVEGSLDNALKPVIPPKLEQGILDVKTDYKQDIKNIAGNSNTFLGSLGSAGNTSGGSEQAIGRAKIIENQVLEQLEEYVEDITEILVEFIIKVYAGEKISIFKGKKANGDYDFEDVKLPKLEKFEDFEYSYNIELDRKTKFSRDRQREMLKEIFVTERQYKAPIKTVTLVDLIENSDLSNKDELALRYNTLNRQSSEEKAELIGQLYQAANKLQASPELLQQAVSEIIGNVENGNAVKEVMNMLEQNFQKEMKNVDQNSQQIDSDVRMENAMEIIQKAQENGGSLPE